MDLKVGQVFLKRIEKVAKAYLKSDFFYLIQVNKKQKIFSQFKLKLEKYAGQRIYKNKIK